jgi:hypothetical protein
MLGEEVGRLRRIPKKLWRVFQREGGLVSWEVIFEEDVLTEMFQKRE